MLYSAFFAHLNRDTPALLTQSFFYWFSFFWQGVLLLLFLCVDVSGDSVLLFPVISLNLCEVGENHLLGRNWREVKVFINIVFFVLTLFFYGFCSVGKKFYRVVFHPLFTVVLSFSWWPISGDGKVCEKNNF